LVLLLKFQNRFFRLWIDVVSRYFKRLVSSWV